MLLTDQNVTHLNTISHDSKVVFFGTGPDGAIWYSVKRSGFEDSALADPEHAFGFEAWKKLPLDVSVDDPSVRAFEEKNLRDKKGNALLRSLYGTGDDVVKTVQAPVQLVSGGGHIYVFRESPASHKILVSRFVLDGMKNELVAKLDVRFRRSRRRLEAQPPGGTSAGALAKADGLDYRDINGNPFYEPATELSFIPATQNGWFSAVLVPQAASDKGRWHIFAYDPLKQKVVLYSVAASDEGLFDVKDQTIGDKGPDGIVYRTISGILQRTIDLTGLTVTGRPAATNYDVQSERQTPEGVMLARDAVRLMLVVPVKEAGAATSTAAAVNYSVAADGTLSQVDLTPDTIDDLRSNARDVILPLTELDDIKVFGQANPPPAGTILAMQRGSQDRVELRSTAAIGAVALNDKVRVYGTRSYDGHYTVTSVNGDTFEIDAGFGASEPGYWEVVRDKETGLTFDNMVLGYEKTAAGKLRVRTASHDLHVGDQVQIIGVDNADGMFTVKVVAADKLGFTVDAPWKMAEAANLTVIKHRGLVFDGADDLLETPSLELSFTAGPDGRFGRTISAWIKVAELASRAQHLAGGEDELLKLAMTADNKVAVATRLSDGTVRTVVDPDAVVAGTWYHYAGTVEYDPAAGGDTRVSLCKNGVKVTPAAAGTAESVSGGDKVVSHDTPPHLGTELLAFDGVDDALEVVPSNASFAKGITVEAWVYLDSPAEASALRGIFNAVAGTEVMLSLAVDGADHTLQAGSLDGGTWSTTKAEAGLTLQRWTHVAATYDNHHLHLYIDGTRTAGATDLDRALPAAATALRIGRHHDTAAAGNLWKGRIAEVRVWNEARTEGQIKGAMFQPLAGTEPTLCGYWPLGNRSLGDRSQRKCHAVAAGDPAWTVATFRFPAPALGAALSFASDADYIDLPDPKIAGTSFSLSFWAKRLSSTGAEQTIVCQGTAADGKALRIGFRADDTLFVSFHGDDLDTTAAYADSAWHHYVLTHDATSKGRVLYRDGVKVAGDTAAAALASAGVLRIGRTTWDSSPSRFSGCIAELCLWSRALSADEAKVEMFRPVAGTESGLLGYWTMESAQARDRGPRKAHGRLKGAPKPYGLHHYIAGVIEQGPARCFAGEMSDVRIWDRALSERETRDTMNLTPTGKEEDLAGYYRMGAVVPGEPALVPDFTSHGRHATVYGTPYGGARSLARATGGDPPAQAVKYANAALVAVRQLATYEESFEFKINGPPKTSYDPENIDGRGNRIFSFTCWGKSSLQSEEVIALPPGSVKQLDFTGPDVDGWYRAACRMIVPEGVRMLRVFELGEVRGAWKTEATAPATEWTSIELRRHKLRLVSDAVSRETYTDVIAAAKLSGLEVGEAELREAEGRVAKHKVEIRDLSKRLHLLQSTADYTPEKNALPGQIASLLKQYTDAENALAAERDNLRNYRFRLRSRRSGYELAGREWYYFNNDDYYYTTPYVDWSSFPEYKKMFLFELRPVDGEWSYLARVGSEQVLSRSDDHWWSGWYGRAVRALRPNTWGNADDRQLWKIVTVSPGVYQVVNKATGWVLEAGWWRDNLVTCSDSGYFDFQHWEVPLKELTAEGLKAIQTRQAAVDAARKNLDEKRQRLLWITSVQASGETIAAVQAALKTARDELALALKDFAARNSVLLKALTGAGAGVAMASVQCDDRGLRTDAALLDFLHPVGGISIAATSEGNVQLDYVDTRGRLCNACYDAVADSRNSTFEQWLPETVRACLDVDGDKAMLETARPIVLPGEGWTLEAWFQYPLATAADGSLYKYNVFASTADGSGNPVCVRGNKLGVLVDHIFMDSGVRLDHELVKGWHHLAAVGHTSRTDFYLNGLLAGGVEAARHAVVFDGVDDFIEVPPSGASFSSGITVEAWVFLDNPAQASDWRGIFSELWEGSAAVQFNLSVHEADHKLQAGFFDGTNWRTIRCTAGLPLNRWVHVAATYDSHYVRVYIDGELAITSADFNQALPGSATQWRIGRRHDAGNPANMWKGKISEVRLWDRALGDYEIEDVLGRSLAGSEANLVGYWVMETLQENGVTKIKDRSSREKHGTLQGKPKVEVLIPQLRGPITCLGNTAAGGSPIGRLSELALWHAIPSAAEVEAMSKLRSSGFEPGLAAFWPLSESDGETAYDHTADNHLTLVGVGRVVCSAAVGSPINVRKPNASDIGDPAFAFDGTNGKVAIAGIDLANKSFTVEFWAQRPRINTEDYFVRQGSAAVDIGLHIGFRSSNVFTFAFYGDDVDTPVYGDMGWHHWACVYDASTRVRRVYRDGHQVAQDTAKGNYKGSGEISLCRPPATMNFGSPANCNVAELRIWNVARTEQQITGSMHARLDGSQVGLLGCWPLSDIEADKTLDLSPGAHHGVTSGGVAAIRTDETLFTSPPPPPEEILTTAVVCADYPTIGVSPAGVKEAIMRRCLGFVQGGQARFLYDAPVEALLLQWIGNAQFNPTLLGYIEGPPPVPSENLTLQDDYAGATSVQLVESQDLDYSYQRGDTFGGGLSVDAFLGAAWQVSAGLGIETTLSEGKAGAQLGYNFHKSTSRSSNVTASSTLTNTDALTLCGAVEDVAAFPHLGRRYVPKNVGYALVISGLADVFITKLARSGRMVGYDVKPVEGVPLDVNTITFLINPTYTLNGSLDGMVGTSAAHKRFYEHVPAMRAQYGSLYPASYYRLQEAYDLAAQIERKDKARETYFINYDATNVYADLPDDQPLDTGSGGSGIDDSAGDDPDAKPDTGKAKSDAKKQSKEKEEEGKKREAEIKSQIDGVGGQTRAASAFADWQQRMENLLVKSGKRNIVNKYVWDADGGLRSEAQSFASAVEHTVGGDVEHEGNFGGVADVQIAAFKLELSIIGSVGGSNSSQKGLSTAKGMELSVDLSGLESKGITRSDDTPCMPGEKVDRYRFMTFYLEPSTDHFDEFFRTVVDPEWLISNDEEARALRQTQAGKANKCWRALHRVTYVERPALMTIGQDVRALPAGGDPDQQMSDYFAGLEKKNQLLGIRLDGLEGKLDAILAKLTQP